MKSSYEGKSEELCAQMIDAIRRTRARLDEIKDLTRTKSFANLQSAPGFFQANDRVAKRSDSAAQEDEKNDTVLTASRHHRCGR